MEQIYDVLIIGGGPAGYTAALYAARAGLDALVLERRGPGGQMALTHWIDNYPGFPEGVEGFELGQRMEAGAARFGVRTVQAEVTAVRLDGKVKEVSTGEGTFRGRTVILATGAEPRKLGISGGAEATGHGISYCAACDGMFYRGKTVAVAGGGNSAAADALLLSRVAKKVIVIHRRDTLRAEKASAAQLMAAENVEFLWNSAVEGLLDGEKFRGVRVREVTTGKETEVVCDGLFVCIGRTPATALFAGQVLLDDRGYLTADESTRTDVAGVFAAGDVRTKAVRQIVTAVADGAAAAHAAAEYLHEK